MCKTIDKPKSRQDVGCTELLCSVCAKQLDQEQAEDPHRDEDGDIVCDECWSEDYEYLCHLCQNLVEIEDNQKHIFVTPALAADQKMQTGIYRVVNLPWFSSNYFSMWILQDAVSLVCDLPAELVDELSGGYLCEDCVHKHNVK